MGRPFSTDPTSPFRAVADGLEIAIRLQPKASANRIDGFDTARGRLRARVTAAPEKGRANAALVRLLAKRLGLPRTGLELVAGGKDRDKTVLIRHDDPADLAARLRSALGDLE